MYPISTVQDFTHVIAVNRKRFGHSLAELSSMGDLSIPVITKIENHLEGQQDVDFFKSLFTLAKAMRIEVILKCDGAEDVALEGPLELGKMIQFAMIQADMSQVSLSKVSKISLTTVRKMIAFADIDNLQDPQFKDVRFRALLDVLAVLNIKMIAKERRLIEAEYSSEVYDYIFEHLKARDVHKIEQLDGLDFSLLTEYGFPDLSDAKAIEALAGSGGTKKMRAVMMCLINLHLMRKKQDFNTYIFHEPTPYEAAIKAYISIIIGKGDKASLNQDMSIFFESLQNTPHHKESDNFVREYICPLLDHPLDIADEMVGKLSSIVGLSFLLSPNQTIKDRSAHLFFMAAVDYGSVKLCKYIINNFQVEYESNPSYLQAIGERLIRPDDDTDSSIQLLSMLLEKDLICEKDRLGYAANALLGRFDVVEQIDHAFCQYANTDPGYFYRKLIQEAYYFSTSMAEETGFPSEVSKYLSSLSGVHEEMGFSSVRSVGGNLLRIDDYINYASRAYNSDSLNIIALMMIQLSISTPFILGDSVFTFLQDLNDSFIGIELQ